MSAPGILLPYQVRWLEDTAGLKVWEKSRRIGASWGEAAAAVFHASRANGGGDVYYQGYSQEMARGFINDCAEWARKLHAAAGVVGEVLIELDDESAIQAFRVTFPSGHKIEAMSSHPRGFRSKGRPGDWAILDEAAFVDSLGEVLEAALAFRMWGGQVHVLSTHNGDASEFNALVKEVREGTKPGSLHRTTFRDALEEGLYRRICEVTEQTWSESAEVAWEENLRAEYGHRAAQELDCIPVAGVGPWLSWSLIHGAEHDHAGDPERYGGGISWIGVDIAARRDLWVAVALEQIGDVLWTREMRVERNIRFEVQYDIVAELDRKYRPTRIAVDQTSMGEAPVQELEKRHGKSRVDGVILSAPRRQTVADALRETMEDRRLRIPSDQDLRLDLHSMRTEVSATGNLRLVSNSKETDGHSDRFWAFAMAVATSIGGEAEYAYRPASAPAPDAGGMDDDYDDDDRESGGRWGRRGGSGWRRAA